jgi:OFA family oxalate/formate antiporter-like MFS transporter
MSTESSGAIKPIKNLGWTVTLAGLGINLALGILYSWSVISKAVPEDWKWSEADRSWPYSIACLVFSLMMVPAGRMQDRIGPRLVATAGGLLVGLGMIVAFLSGSSHLGYLLGFGVLAGTGIGFGYASATPPAVKWFPAARTGLIAGLVVAGFGLASVYAAPLTQWLIGMYEIPTTMLILGIAFLIVVMGLAQLLTPPPKGYVPAGSAARSVSAQSVKGGQAFLPVKKEDFGPKEMLGTVQFYLMWFLYACGAGAGLMIIAKLATIGKGQTGIEQGFILVAACAIGNGAGRIIAGTLSDKLGRQQTLRGCFVFQAVLMLVLSLAGAEHSIGSLLGSLPVMMLLSALIGANYGANLSIFPSVTKDYYGLKNFGVNYGLVFTAWGIGGFALSLVAGQIFDAYKCYTCAYYLASGLLILAAAASFFLKAPSPKA